jgi:hypothetical protein
LAGNSSVAVEADDRAAVSERRVDGGGLRRVPVSDSQDEKGRAMKKYEWSLLPVVVLLMGAGPASAAARLVADATIPFAFVVSGAEVPAGKYEVLVEDPSVGTLILRNAESGKTILVPFTTRLAMRPADEDLLVFDRAGDKHYLSEIYISGSDGYFLPGAPSRHTHAQVKVSKKKS